ncbi:MAG: hypothetical protein ACRC2Y_04975 [Aeromonas veronii]
MQSESRPQRAPIGLIVHVTANAAKVNDYLHSKSVMIAQKGLHKGDILFGMIDKNIYLLGKIESRMKFVSFEPDEQIRQMTKIFDDKKKFEASLNLYRVKPAGKSEKTITEAEFMKLVCSPDKTFIYDKCKQVAEQLAVPVETNPVAPVITLDF